MKGVTKHGMRLLKLVKRYMTKYGVRYQPDLIVTSVVAFGASFAISLVSSLSDILSPEVLWWMNLADDICVCFIGFFGCLT